MRRWPRARRCSVARLAPPALSGETLLSHAARRRRITVTTGRPQASTSARSAAAVPMAGQST